MVISLTVKIIFLFAVQNWLGLCSCAGFGTVLRILTGIAALTAFIILNVKPSFRKYDSSRIRIMRNGAELLIMFLVLTVLDIAFGAYLIGFSEASLSVKIINCCVAVLTEAVLFFNGIARVYTTSVQLGIKWRVIGLVCGFVPVLNIVVLVKIISLTLDECAFEQEKCDLNNVRKESEICKTRYPILLVHGVFFRDVKLLNYWGRIPSELIKNGAEVYYGQQESAASVADCAKQLVEKIEKIVAETGCEKVNIIAHSKGGLDSRYALSILGASKYVASLTTINTPHRGCVFAEYLLEKIPDSVCMGIAKKYNAALKKLGDKNPDFISAVKDLTATNCKALNESCPDAEGVYYQSVGSIMPKASRGKFPLNFSYRLVKYFDGENDGLVSAESMKWGESFTMINENYRFRRGVSHGDVIDLNRENISGFDVREFYVGLVKDLKEKGF